MFATFSTFIGETLVFAIVAGAVMLHFAIKFLNANPDVKDTAKRAAAQKSISWITKFFGK